MTRPAKTTLAQRVKAECREQGVPVKITDPLTYRRIVGIVRNHLRHRGDKAGAA